MAEYRKSIAALLGALATWGLTAAADGHYDQTEWFGLLAALAAVTAVWGASNDPPFAVEQAEPDAGAGELSIVLICAAVSIVVLTVYVLFVK